MDTRRKPSLERLQETALQRRNVVDQAVRNTLVRGEVAVLRDGKTGAKVCKFVLGEGEDARLVVLAKQRGEVALSGMIHERDFPGESNRVTSIHGIRFDEGRTILPAEIPSLISELE